MPPSYFVILIIGVIAASGLTIAIGYSAGLSLALPALLGVTALYFWRTK